MGAPRVFWVEVSGPIQEVLSLFLEEEGPHDRTKWVSMCVQVAEQVSAWVPMLQRQVHGQSRGGVGRAQLKKTSPYNHIVYELKKKGGAWPMQDSAAEVVKAF